ncbi:MAG TPA: methyltransferase domain-containing protein [Bryobacteraceae bacterium]|jgi:ubiquinone/menaquinone biosynthesis C-methylase UbiE|nr:methyltransferase domain-containing protein [Bryobacteraceae bacterium]
MTVTEHRHKKQILDQFTRQAQPFAAAPAHSDEDSLRILAEAVDVMPEDRVLDVACGPGIVACMLAARAQHVTGIDMVPAMLEEARNLQARKGLENLSWKLGEAMNLPFEDESFSLVISRYSFHHLLEPAQVLKEMTRVCRRGGRVAVADVTPDADKAQAYDELEKLRDPSHTQVVPVERFQALGEEQGLELRKLTSYRLEVGLDELLAASFPPEGNADRIRQKIRADIGSNRLSTNARWEGDKLVLGIPISVLVWRKPAAE